MKKIVELFFGIVVLAIALIGFPFVAPILENPAPAKSIRAEIEQARYNDIRQLLPDTTKRVQTSNVSPAEEIDLGQTFIIVDTTQVF